MLIDLALPPSLLINHSLPLFVCVFCLQGADDSIVNADGLTCYEGLSRSAMNEEYGDGEEDEDEDGDAGGGGYGYGGEEDHGDRYADESATLNTGSYY